MITLVGLLAAIIRLLRPTRGAHTTPLGYLRELRAETRRHRANRVRRYAVDVPTVAHAEDVTDAPRVPAPRRSPDHSPSAALRPVPAGCVPVVAPSVVAAPTSIVRAYYRAHEARQERARADRGRSGVTVLMDLAEVAR